MNFFQHRKQRKRLKALVHHARGLRHMREDVLPAADLAGLDAATQAAVQACQGRDAQAMAGADKALGERIDALTPLCSLPAWRENFEVLVVALGVAMAFRAYFYQPFQIPTGSMQPTLYGVSSREQAAPRLCDRPVIKAANWLAAGEWFGRVETHRAGKIAVLWNDDRVPGYTTVVCGKWPGELPPEALHRRESAPSRKLYALGSRLGAGALDRGYDIHFLPNDVAGRHAGIYRAGFVPAAPAQAQVAEKLRLHALRLKAAAGEHADDETRAFALQHAAPVVASVANWSRGGVLDDASLQVTLYAYEACELRRQGRRADPVREQQACQALQRLFAGWSAAASAGSPEIPWFPLLSGCGVERPAGQLLWSGVVTEGDFVFVNRWAWNFRLPRRGEVMVFSTRDIRGLPEGTHYIKRMCGLPGEVLSIHPPELWIDGAAVYEPHAIARIARREKLAAWAPPYAGYRTVGEVDARYARALRTPEDSIQLSADEYFAMGDNTPNSLDGRYWGPVPRRNLLGPATLVYWPFGSRRWGRIE
ncbi:MAG: signal peptidase I [bacterium]